MHCHRLRASVTSRSRLVTATSWVTRSTHCPEIEAVCCKFVVTDALKQPEAVWGRVQRLRVQIELSEWCVWYGLGQVNLVDIFPTARGRVLDRALKHWPYAICPWRVGRLDLIDDIRAPHDNVHYCGDYTENFGLESAVLSAKRVVSELANR